MWDWINCHLAGRHEYAVWSDTNRVYLRCLRCGRRSSGWDVGAGHEHETVPHVPHVTDDKPRAAHGRFVAGAMSLVGFMLLGR